MSEAETTAVETVETTTVLTDEQNSEATTVAEEASDAAAVAAAGEAGSDAGEKAGEEGSQTVPETYADFAMPEGITLDEAALTGATPIFKDLGLNQDQAQKLIDVYAAQVQAGMDQQVDAFNQQKAEWRDASAADKEFGGDAFDENVKIAQAAVNKFGTPELKQLLEDYGVGNHPEVIRFMVNVGKLTAEDVPGATGGVANAQKSAVDVLYPNDQKS